MRLFNRLCLLRAALVCAVALISACQPKVPDMTPEETQHIDALTAHMKPRCVGRYLIDLPDQFVINEISRTVIEGVTIETKPMTKALFETHLRHRRQELEAKKIDGKNIPSLAEVKELPNGAGLVFNRSESGAYEFARTWELISWSNGFLLTMTNNATDMSREESVGKDSPLRTDVPEKLNELLNLYARTRTRKDTDVPTDQGVCFANGFIKGPPGDSDWIDMYHHLDGVPDVYASFSYLSNIGPESTTLLQRGKDIDAALANENGKTLRKGHRSANGLEFEEWIVQRQPEPKEPMMYDVNAEMNSKAGNAQRPLLVFGLVSGVKHPRPSPTLEQAATEKPLEKVTLNAAETVALWDRISATLRPRPGAF